MQKRDSSSTDKDKAFIKKACRILGPSIRNMDGEEYRRTNKAYSENYLDRFDINSVEWIRYLTIFEIIRKSRLTSAHDYPSVLEIGTNLGVLTLAYSFIFPNHQLVSMDHPFLAQESVKKLFPILRKQGIEMVVCDLDKPFPFNSKSFDLVLFLAVIEHLPNSPRFQLEEILRILKPEGLLILDTPNLGAFERKYNMLIHGKGPYFELEHFFFSESPFSGHHREYNLAEVKQMLEWTGFSVNQAYFFDCAPRVTKSPKNFLSKMASHYVPRFRHAMAIVAQPT